MIIYFLNRMAMSKEKAMDIIKEESGKQFDPSIAQILLEIV